MAWWPGHDDHAGTSIGQLGVRADSVPASAPGLGAATGNFDLASLSERCAFIISNGSGSGTCPGCTTGALGVRKCSLVSTLSAG